MGKHGERPRSVLMPRRTRTKRWRLLLLVLAVVAAGVAAFVIVRRAGTGYASYDYDDPQAFQQVAASDPGYPQKVSWVTVCAVATTGSFDPIVYPGLSNASHNHTFSGALDVSPDSTADTLSAGRTNCTNSGDHASYWMPTLSSDGTALLPYVTRVYYRAGTSHPEQLKPIPFGLKMIAGDPLATEPQKADIAGYQCRKEGEGDTVAKQSTPPFCPAGSLFEMSVKFPNCWDGTNLDSPDHRSHVSYAVKYQCDAAHPVMIPQITLAERFEPGTVDAATVTLGAMPGMSSNVALHGDVLSAWDPALMDRLLRDCLRAGRACQGVSDDRMPPEFTG